MSMSVNATQILMIEDDDQDVEIVRELLNTQQNSVNLQHRRSLSQGISYLHESDSIDLVLLDLCLSDTQGLDTFHTVHERFPTLPLVILSGNTDETIAIEAMKEGAQDFLVKGRFNSSLLSRTIRYALERQKQQLELQYKTVELLTLSEQLELANRELERMATLDGLTQVHNRRQFDSVFQTEWNRLCREGQPLSLILSDVDHFKAYNDTYGHPAGDQCLKLVAQAIAKVAKRPADCVARYGGEEFAVLLPHTDITGALHVAEGVRLAVEELSIPHHHSSASDHVTLSLGVTSFVPNEEVSPSWLIEAADRALYAAKDLGRNQIQAYQEPSTSEPPPSLLGWTQRIQQAIEHNYFRLYAQPIQRLNHPQGKQYFEILLRLCDQPGIAIKPGLFLPIAEQNNLMTQIDHWVIEHLFADLHEIHGIMQQNAQFFINLSAKSCQNSDLIDYIQQQLLRYDLQPDELCFEITEGAALRHFSSTKSLSKDLKAMGCQVALDDFGSGLSSLRLIKSIAADYVKIDGSFVKEVATDPVSIEMVGAIHMSAKNEGIKTIAEFVESQQILDTLSSFDIDFAQGHYYAKARPLIETLVASQSMCYRRGTRD